MKSPILPPHPLDHPGAIKILLGREASEAIAANGDHHLAVITHPDATSPPEAAGRLVLVCVPLPKQALDDAAAVALGRARVVRIKTPSTSSPSIAPAPVNECSPTTSPA